MLLIGTWGTYIDSCEIGSWAIRHFRRMDSWEMGTRANEFLGNAYRGKWALGANT